MLVRERGISIELYDVNGRVWYLNDPTSQVRIVRGGLPALEAKLIPQKVAGRVQPGSGIPQSQQATMRVGFYPGPEDLGALKRRFRAGWAHDRECTLRVSGGTMLPVEAHLRLPDDGAITSPQVLSPRQVFEVMEVPVWWEDGVWWDKHYFLRPESAPTKKIKSNDWAQSEIDAYAYELTNHGCVPLKIGVQTENGLATIQWPSGMVIAPNEAIHHDAWNKTTSDANGLPLTIGDVTVWLDRKKGMPVNNERGENLPHLQRAWWYYTLSGVEYVMPGEKITLLVDSKARGVHAWTGVKSPWA